MVKRNNTKQGVTEYAHGIGIEPSSKAIIGSQEVPFIYEDRLSGSDVTEALLTMYTYSREKRQELGKAGRQHVLDNYNFETFAQKWKEVMTKIHEEHGSWETRKNYNRWELIAV